MRTFTSQPIGMCRLVHSLSRAAEPGSAIKSVQEEMPMPRRLAHHFISFISPALDSDKRLFACR